MDMIEIDLSSDQPHIFNDCPMCKHEFHVKVTATGNCPKCGAAYTMERIPGSGDISVGWQLTFDQYQTLFGDKKLN